MVLGVIGFLLFIGNASGALSFKVGGEESDEDVVEFVHMMLFMMGVLYILEAGQERKKTMQGEGGRKGRKDCKGEEKCERGVGEQQKERLGTDRKAPRTEEERSIFPQTTKKNKKGK